MEIWYGARLAGCKSEPDCCQSIDRNIIHSRNSQDAIVKMTEIAKPPNNDFIYFAWICLRLYPLLAIIRARDLVLCAFR